MYGDDDDEIFDLGISMAYAYLIVNKHITSLDKFAK